jgi:hypothetical protein
VAYVGVGNEKVGKDAARVVGVVQEQHQIAQADQGIRAVAGSGQVAGVAVHVTDHMDAHPAVAG